MQNIVSIAIGRNQQTIKNKELDETAKREPISASTQEFMAVAPRPTPSVFFGRCPLQNLNSAAHNRSHTTDNRASRAPIGPSVFSKTIVAP